VNGWLAAVRAESLRLSRPLRLALLPAAALLAFLYASGLGIAAENGVLGSKSGFWLAASSSSGIALTCALLGALLAAIAVGGDLASGVARVALCTPVSRGQWMAGRITTLAVGMALVYAFAALGALAAAAARFGLHGAFEGDYEIASAGFLTGQLLISWAVCLCALACAVALGALAGSVVGRAGGAVAVVALLGAGLTALGRWSRAESYLPGTYLSRGLDRVAQLGQGIAGAHASDGALLALAVCAAWTAAAGLLAALALSRRDILT
jgi:ABC-type transport system involved in multi-copper enzyme maturation permease subunit